MDQITEPMSIEQRSFELIAEGLGDRQLDPQYASIIKRVIHTTADFDFADNLVFSDDLLTVARQIFQAGARLVTDTKMAMAGINKKALAALNCSVDCFIDNPDVVATAKSAGGTRARAAIDYAVKTLEPPIVFVIGNAPTALIRIQELVTAGDFKPAMVIGVPVGFVNVVESKEMILSLGIPYIVARGRKGGSNVAAAICNALLYQFTERPEL